MARILVVDDEEKMCRLIAGELEDQGHEVRWTVRSREAADILIDGTQDPALTCNGISIGLGFTLTEVRLGEIAPPLVWPEDPCP